MAGADPIGAEHCAGAGAVVLELSVLGGGVSTAGEGVMLPLSYDPEGI